MKSLKVSDNRTIVTEVLLVRNGNTADNYYSVAYKTKGTNSVHLLNPTDNYNYVELKQIDLDHFYAITNDGRSYERTITTNALWEGHCDGFTTTSSSTNTSKDDKDAARDRSNLKEKKGCSSSSNPCGSCSNSFDNSCECESLGPCSICKCLWKMLCCFLKEV